MLKALVLGAALLVHGACARNDRAGIAPLGDEQFWQLSASLSEPAGVFDQADNLVSNEVLFAQLAQTLRPREGAYIGVGPEQNFSYIARLRPAIAFIVDIREENRHLHLMYKALFELAPDRADFVARLFSRRRPPGLDAGTSVADLFAAFAAADADTALLAESVTLIRDHLLESRGLPLSPADLTSIHATLAAFHADGPAIRYGRAMPPSRTRPSYQTLMTTGDLRGNPQSYLASEESFAFVKQLHTRNLIVPVVGDFAGAHTLRRVAGYLREHRQPLAAFYASNVEVYLTRDQRRTFCATLATLPFDEATYFIENRRLLTVTEKLEGCARISPSLHWP
jgi:hypothetical protein